MEIDFPLEIKVKTNKKKTEVVSYNPFILDVKEKAENNKANLEVIKFLSKYFGKRVRIVKGFKSKIKVIDLI